MPSNKPRVATEPVYTIWMVGKIYRGTAHDLLEGILKRAKSDSLRNMTIEQYAQTLIEDADYFIPETLFDFLRRQPYASDSDRALRYLSEMTESGIRILETKGVAGETGTPLLEQA